MFAFTFLFVVFIIDQSKAVSPVSKNEIVVTIEVEVIGHPGDAPKGKWTFKGDIKVLCMYKLYGPKKNKTELRNELKRSL